MSTNNTLPDDKAALRRQWEMLKLQVGQELAPALQGVADALAIACDPTPLRVLLARPLGLVQRLEVFRAAWKLGDTTGVWRVLLFGRTGPMPSKPIRFEWHQFEVDLAAPGMLPAFIGARVSRLRGTGWMVNHWTVQRWRQSSVYCVRASRRRCPDCDISPPLRVLLRRSPCSTCNGRGFMP
jgi:hypothetical protein